MVVEVDLWHAGGGGLSSAHAHALLTRVPASLPLHNRHLLSSTFVGVARQAQWFDEQVGERPSRCRTIGCGASRGRLRIRPASGGSNNTEVFAAFARVHALEGEGGGGRRRRREVAARAADGLDAGREAAPWARRRQAAPWASWTRVVPRAILASLRGPRAHAPDVAGRPRRVVYRLVWLVFMIVATGVRRFEARGGFCAQWTRHLRALGGGSRGGCSDPAVPSRVGPAMAG